MIAANKASIPGNNELDAVSLWAAWLQGKVAMIYSWPPTGRMTAGYSQSDKAINFIPQSSIAGKVGYAVVPGNPEHATGYNKALAADSANPEAAYLFMQWAMLAAGVAGPLHAALRAARSLSPLALQVGALRRALPDAPRTICVNLNNSANVGLLDLIMPGAQDYALASTACAPSVWAGTDPKAALEDGGGGMGCDHRASRRRLARRPSTPSS